MRRRVSSRYAKHQSGLDTKLAIAKRPSCTPELRLHDISKKQRDALNLLILNHSSKEIARILSISPRTVDQRFDALREKFGVSTRNQLAQIYRTLLEKEGALAARSICNANTSESNEYCSPCAPILPKAGMKLYHQLSCPVCNSDISSVKLRIAIFAFVMGVIFGVISVIALKFQMS